MLMVRGTSGKVFTKDSVARVRVGAGGLILKLLVRNVRLLCVFKLVLEFSPGGVICRGEKKIQSVCFCGEEPNKL